METSGQSFGAKLNAKLQESVKPDDVGTQFMDVLPWVGGLVIVCFVIYEVRKLVKGAAKAKVRL